MLEFEYSGSWNNNGYSGHYYINTYPLEGEPNKLKSSGSVNNCREFYVRSLRHTINGSNSVIPQVRRAYALTTQGYCTRGGLEKAQELMMEAAEKSVYIINSFEKEHKWPLTKIYPVRCTNITIPLVFFSGPRKWTTSPYLMSIWSLMIRLGHAKFMPKKLLTFDHETLVKQLIISARRNNTLDANQLRQTLLEWDNFMYLYKDLFGQNSRRYHWDKGHINGFNDRPEGILMLIKGTSGYKALTKRFFELKREKDLK